jgi:hypothetical protein
MVDPMVNQDNLKSYWWINFGSLVSLSLVRIVKQLILILPAVTANVNTLKLRKWNSLSNTILVEIKTKVVHNLLATRRSGVICFMMSNGIIVTRVGLWLAVI